MKNIRLTVQYDGTDFCGWQIQNNVRTVQGELERAVYKLTGAYSALCGCSRTDAGVHALSHISNFFTESSIPSDKFCYALNTVLPKDIVVKASCEAAHEFHARFSCTGKRYLYRIYCCNTQSALLQDRAWFEPRELDSAKMNQAAEFFKGEFDFSAFCAVGGSAQSPVRRMFDAKVYETDSVYGGKEVLFEVAGTGFLYNMVRIMAGTLLNVGKGRIRPEDIEGIISSMERKNAGATAPPQGLYLKEVYY